MHGKHRSIRVNLRFGARTDPRLLHELNRLAPQDRARWVRSWVLEGWRARSSEALTRISAPVSSAPSMDLRDQLADAAVPTVDTRPPSAAASLEDHLLILIAQSAR